jgi:hypothetical protein
MQKPDRSSFTVLDFHSWEEAGTLSLNPKFQRRAVWKLPARSYLIDTLLKGMPVPPIYLRVTQNESKTKTIREVIDGQQRLRAVLDYLKDEFALSKAVSDEAPGRRFSQLTDSQKDEVRKYSFICESFSSIADADVLEVFARMNTHSVKLNAQELRNGKFFGHFKRLAYRLGHEHLEFWRGNRIFTEDAIARMLEVELVSEILVAQMAGLQDKKKSLDGFYRDFDEEFPDSDRHQKRFRSVIDAISETLGESLRSSEFRRPPLFYSLFTVLDHRLHGLPGAAIVDPHQGRLSRDDGRRLKDALVALSDRVAAAREGEPTPLVDLEFVGACLRQTDNIRPRRIRFEWIYKRSFV